MVKDLDRTGTPPNLDAETSQLTENEEREQDAAQFRERLRALVPKGNEKSFADACGIGENTLRYTLKTGNPGRKVLAAIARGAGVSADWLIFGEKALSAADRGFSGRTAQVGGVDFAALEKVLDVILEEAGGAPPAEQIAGLTVLACRLVQSAPEIDAEALRQLIRSLK